MKDSELYHEDHEATYCPEDNKLRLYVGRVPREEYLALRREGWTSTPKQDCDFAATWTPEREDTALSYAGIIGDEDQSPQDRAADRAERFSGYRDKRLSEAVGYADSYDSGPSVFGHQDKGRATREADKHDRIAGRAVNQWDKAEYWTRRTAGVIDNALYRSQPGVRMGRIKTIEKDIRRIEANYTPNGSDSYQNENGERFVWCGLGRGGHWVREADLEVRKAAYARTLSHLKLRLAYENQMLREQGGRLEQSGDIKPGGTIGGKLVIKVNKSSQTKRITSVSLLGPRVEGWVYKASNIPGTEWAEYRLDTERLSMNAYKEPTPESLEQLKEYRAKVKAAKAKLPKKPSLINPTDKDAEKLQAIWSKQRGKEYKIIRMTQAEYSAQSKGGFARFETEFVEEGGTQDSSTMGESSQLAKVCKVRARFGSVVVLTDKPQKPLPLAVWSNPKGDARKWCRENLQACHEAIQAKRNDTITDDHAEAWRMLRRAKWASSRCRKSATVKEELSELIRDHLKLAAY